MMQNSIKLFVRTAFSIGLFFLAAIAADAQTTFTVNSINDTPDANTADNVCDDGAGACTLRAAIEQANATAGADTINFSNAVFGAAKTIALGGGLPNISEALTITGTSSALLTIDANGNGRVFAVNASVTATISNLTAANGFVFGASGGCVANSGSLTLTGVVVRDCVAIVPKGGGDGGGIVNLSGATLTLTNSTVRDNLAGGRGGGIANLGGTVSITRSTVGSATMNGSNVANNSGGGIYNENGTVNLTNSTVSGNKAINFGGGYYGFGNLGVTILNSAQATIANNSALNGGGIALGANVGISSTGNVNNTIIGDNTAGSQGADVFNNPAANGVFVSGGFNLIENTAGGATIVLLPTDQTGDPMLSPLALNGGATETHALQIGSPAIDQGSSAVSGQTSDQRGQAIYNFPNVPDAVPMDGKDIGAFELQPPPTAAVASIGGRVTIPSGKGLSKARVTLTDSSGQTRTALTNSFGFYRFADVAAGETYTLNVVSEPYAFSPQQITINEDTSDLNFAVEQ